jgi:DNA modification methylase
MLPKQPLVLSSIARFPNMMGLFESDLIARHKFARGRNESEHLLLTGDCLEILPRMKAGVIDLLITDPPYNKNLNYGKYFKDKKSEPGYFKWCRRWLTECARVLSRKGSIYLISYPEINARLLPILVDEQHLKFRRWLTWHYPTNIGHSKRNYTRSQRSILFLTKSNQYVFNRQQIIQHYKNPEVSKIRNRIANGSSGRASYDLLRFLDLMELSKGMIDIYDFNLLKNVSKDRFTGEHPCQLPLTLLRLLTKVSSNPGSVVLDPFAGTFSLSAIAADLGRASVGIEINPNFVELGKRRMAKWINT